MAGQINLDSEMGQLIKSYAENQKYSSYLEIGAWNGEGSTTCFIQGLKNRDDDYSFISLEACPNFYSQAKKYCKQSLSDKIQILHGRIVDDEELIKDSKEPQHSDFLKTDRNNYNTCVNVWGQIKNQNFDVVLLDGGEFSTWAEFKKLQPITMVFILDDCKMLKNKKVVEELNSSSQWRLVKSSNKRNGFAIYERVLNVI